MIPRRGILLCLKIMGRNWNLSANWCSLCQEPHNDFPTHIGKRDHICLEMIFDAICMQPRRWIPSHVWRAMEHKEFSTTVDFSSVLRSLNVQEQLRRERLLSILFYLKRCGILRNSLPRVASVSSNGTLQCNVERKFSNCSKGGHIIMEQFIIPGILRMFPRSNSKQQAAFSDQVLIHYHLNQTFELLGLQSLIDGASKDTISMLDKTLIQRAILYELCEFVDPVGSSDLLPKRDGPVERLAQHAAECLVAEWLSVKAMEYVIRVEPVWRMYGSELVSGFFQARGLTAMVSPRYFQHMSAACFNPEKPYHPHGSQSPEEPHSERLLSIEEVAKLYQTSAFRFNEEKKVVVPKNKLADMLSRSGVSQKLNLDLIKKKHLDGKDVYEASVTFCGITHTGGIATTITEAETRACSVALKHITENRSFYEKHGLVSEGNPLAPDPITRLHHLWSRHRPSPSFTHVRTKTIEGEDVMTAKLHLPNGKTFTGAALVTKARASASAAVVALEHMKSHPAEYEKLNLVGWLAFLKS